MGLEQIEVELQDILGNDRQISEAAWTSSLEHQNKSAKTDEDVKRIVNMLADLKHSVPFESVIFRWWIRMPISTDRQFVTHRIASHSGLSGRYRTMPKSWEKLPEDVLAICEKAEYGWEAQEYEELCAAANDWYNDSLKNLRSREQEGKITNAEYKRCREFFRGVLPQNNMTERLSIFNLRSWANFQKLRNSVHAQPEIKRVAELMLKEVKAKNCCPIALEALERNNWVI